MRWLCLINSQHFVRSAGHCTHYQMLKQEANSQDQEEGDDAANEIRCRETARRESCPISTATKQWENLAITDTPSPNTSLSANTAVKIWMCMPSTKCVAASYVSMPPRHTSISIIGGMFPIPTISKRILLQGRIFRVTTNKQSCNIAKLRPLVKNVCIVAIQRFSLEVAIYQLKINSHDETLKYKRECVAENAVHMFIIWMNLIEALKLFHKSVRRSSLKLTGACDPAKAWPQISSEHFCQDETSTIQWKIKESKH